MGITVQTQESEEYKLPEMSTIDTQGVISSDIQKREQTQNANILQLTMAALRLTSTAVSTVQLTTLDSNASKLREISLDEVSLHYDRSDCWLIIYDRVYDVTRFLDTVSLTGIHFACAEADLIHLIIVIIYLHFQHPGGYDVLLEYAGRDASFAFRGTGHSDIAIKLLKKYVVGELPLQECIFRTKTGIKVSDLPD